MVAGLSASTCADHRGPVILHPRRSSSVAMPPSRIRRFAISSWLIEDMALCGAFARITECHAGGQFAPSAEVGDGDDVADLMMVHDLVNVLGAGDLPAIDTDNEVAAKINLHVAEVRRLAAAV